MRGDARRCAALRVTPSRTMGRHVMDAVACLVAAFCLCLCFCLHCQFPFTFTSTVVMARGGQGTQCG